VGSVVIVEDVTRLTRWQEQVQRTNRLDALGEMAVSIAQEVRNALGSMELFASLLKQELEHEAEKAMLAEHILSGVKSLNQTISNLLAFTRCPIPCSTSVDPHRVLEESLIFASQLVRHHHLSLQKSFGADGVTIAADAALLKQVFLNLLLNAIQAMPTGGTLTLATRLHRDALEVRVSDTGLGIPPEVIEKIFNPFFTTKERGTGLGLTVVHNIMAAHKGIVHVVSMPGQGTTVTLSFPLEPAAAGLSPWASEGSDLEDRSLRHVDCGVDSTAR
jgi:signal transduction histidine kinase